MDSQEATYSYDSFGAKTKSPYSAEHPEGMKASSRNVTGYILPPPKIPELGEKQKEQGYIFANEDIEDITNTHDTGIKSSEMSDELEGAEPKIAGDANNLNSLMQNSENSGDKEPTADAADNEFIKDFTKL